jgi:hypothetical protein
VYRRVWSTAQSTQTTDTERFVLKFTHTFCSMRDYKKYHILRLWMENLITFI